MSRIIYYPAGVYPEGPTYSEIRFQLYELLRSKGYDFRLDIMAADGLNRADIIYKDKKPFLIVKLMVWKKKVKDNEQNLNHIEFLKETFNVRECLLVAADVSLFDNICTFVSNEYSNNS